MATEKYNYAESEEIHLIDYINVLLKRRKLIVLGVFFTVILTGIISKMMLPIYVATAKFLPSKNPDMISRMGTLIGVGGKIESFEDNVTADYYTELLKSSFILERVARKKIFSKKLGKEIDLITYYNVPAKTETERILKTIKVIAGNLKVSTDKRTNVVSISYSSYEPELSAAIVNAFLEELIIYNQNIRNTKAKQNRIFIERQLEETRKLLKKAEAELAEFTAKNKKIVTPDLELEYERLKRNVKVQEEVFITLKKQLELAKIEEEEKKPVIEIIENATVPLTKSKPKTKLNIIISGLLSIFIFTFIAFFLEFFSKTNRDDKRYKEFYKYLNDVKNDFRFIIKLFSFIKKKH